MPHGINFQPMPKRFLIWEKHEKRFSLRVPDNVHDLYDFVETVFYEHLISSQRDIDNGFIILQSTNLFDKDGKEIFEGHIVDNGLCRAICIWDNSNAEFDFISIIGRDNTKGFLEEYKIIGHIFTNPELLEKGE